MLSFFCFPLRSVESEGLGVSGVNWWIRGARSVWCESGFEELQGGEDS